jgi:uncharacterized protein
MNRTLLFLLVALFVIAVDFYAYQGLKVAIAPFSPLAQKISKGIFWGLSIVTILGFLLFDTLSQTPAARPALTFIMTIGMANILGKILFAVWLIIDDLIRLGKVIWQRLNPVDHSSSSESTISRNEFLTRAGAITAALPVIGMTWGIVSGAHDYRIIRRTLSIPNLTSEFEGFTITHLSDIHTGSFWSKKAVAKGIQMVKELNSDAIFFTGDLVNNMATELDGWEELFSSITAKHGVFSVLGNHDYGDYVAWETDQAKKDNLNSLLQRQRDMGWDVLLDENRQIKIGDQAIDVVGIQNWGAKGRFPKYGSMEKAVLGLEKNTVKLLLSHDPSHWKAEVLKDYPQIDAMFSGHTHGFQFGIEVGSAKWSPVKYFYPEWADLYTEKDQLLYVNRGFGYIGYPGRLGILPEITVHTLVRSNP